MKRYILITLMALFSLITFCQNINELDEKYGFKSTKLGSFYFDFKNLEKVKYGALKYTPTPDVYGRTEPSSVPDPIYKYTEANLVEYYDKNIDLKIGAFPLDNVLYKFYKNILISITIQIGVSNDQEILQILESAYSKGKNVKDNTGDEYYEWNGNKVYMKFIPTSKYWQRDKPIIYIESKSLKAWKDKDLSEKQIELNKRKHQDAVNDL